MIFIKKSSAPDKLTAYLRQSHSPSYDDLDLDVKDAVRKGLIKEQGYLCAYCNSRIHLEISEDSNIPRIPPTTRIDHCVAQSDTLHGAELSLNYPNMVLSCDSRNMGEETCDKFKKDKPLPFSPLNKSDMETIYYSKDGTIHSSNPEDDKALNDVLNLNAPQLKRNRKAAWVETMNLISSRCNNGAWDASKIRKYLGTATTPDRGGRLPEYCGIIRYFLTRWLNRHS